MQCFQFTLETLLSLRRAKLEQQEQQLADAVTNYNCKQRELQLNRESSFQTWGNLRGSGLGTSQGQKLDPRKSHSDYLYLDRLEKQGLEIDEKVHKARLAMEVEQKRYADMRKDQRVLEKLREKQYQAYMRRLERIQDEASAEMIRAREIAQVSRAYIKKPTVSVVCGAKKEDSWPIH